MSNILKQIDNFIIKYKEGITVGIPTKISTTRGKYDALRYKKVPIEQLMTKSTESFSLIGSYKSGENSVELQSNNNINQILVNGEKIYENDNLGDVLNRYYHELKNIASSQTDNTDLALQIFGDMVVEQNRKILPMLNQLGKLSEAKIFEKQWAQFGVVPFNEEKDTDTVVSRAIPAKEFSKKVADRTEQHPIIGGDVRHPGIADFGMQADVRKTLSFISKEADIHGAMIFVALPADVKERILLSDGEPKDKLHITLIHLTDDAAKITSKQQNNINSAIEEVIVGQDPIIITLTGVGRFTNNDNDDEALYASVSSDLLVAARNRLAGKLDNYNIDYSKNFDYTPHVTLKYLKKDAATPNIKINETFVINTFSIAFNGKITNFIFDNGEVLHKYEAGKEADKHKYVKKLEGGEEAPEGTYVTESKGHTYAYSKDEWGVAGDKEENVSNPLSTLSQAFVNKGFELYEVGGRVRDSLLGRESHDIDLATNATPDETQAIIEELNLGTIYDVGKRFGTIGVTPKTGNSIEITTYRGETYTPGSRKPGVSFGGKLSLKDDLSRRDFTINSLARSVRDNKIVDYFSGQEDLKNKIIRAVGNPQERYAEDPLRMLRAARFAAQLDFNVDTQMPEPEKLRDISKERIASELDRILLSQNPIKGFDVMKQFGLTKYVIPELDTLSGVSQQPHHANDVYEHVLEVIGNASKIKLDNPDDKHILMLSALLHDIAKPTTRTEAEGKAHFYEHEKAGADKAREILTALKYSNDIIDKVTTLIKHHMYILHTLNSADVSDKQLKRFIFSVGVENVPLLIALAKADAKSSTRTDTTFIDKLEERIKTLPQEQKQTQVSPLNGDEIMEKFNIKPGKIITEIKNHLINKIVDGELNPDDKDKAYEFATKFVEENKNMINKSMDDLNDEDENDDSTSETVEFETEDIPNEDGTITTNYTVKKISPYQSAAEDGESMVNNENGVFEKQMKPSSFGPPTLSPGWVPGRQTMGKIPVRVPIKRQGKIYYGIRWKSPGEGGITYPSLKPQGHLIRPEDYLEDSLVHSTLYYGTDEETANSIFKNGFKVGTSGRFGIAFYLYTNINRARMKGKTIVMSKLYTEEVFIIAHPNADEKATQYADYIIHGLRRTLGEPQGKADIGMDWNNEFNKRGIKALAYSLNFEEDVKKDYELEIIVFTPDVLKIIADVKKNIGAEDIKKDIGEDTPNPDYNNMPKYTYGTAIVPDANIMNKQAVFSTKDQQTAEVGNNQYPIKHPIGPNLDKQKPIVEK